MINLLDENNSDSYRGSMGIKDATRQRNEDINQFLDRRFIETMEEHKEWLERYALNNETVEQLKWRISRHLQEVKSRPSGKIN